VPRIVSTVADAYGVLPHTMSQALRGRRPEELTPYEAAIRAFGYHERVGPEEHAEVRAGLRLAFQRDPANADCWASLAHMCLDEYRNGFNPEPDPLGRALQAARRAVDLGLPRGP
jgi:hypothetical protein